VPLGVSTQAGANFVHPLEGAAAVIMLAETVDAVIGVDTHTDTHTACLIDSAGRELAAVTVEATPAGYRKLLGWSGQVACGPRLVWAGVGPAGGCRRSASTPPSRQRCWHWRTGFGSNGSTIGHRAHLVREGHHPAALPS
jgi:hypothetical protein